MTAPTDGMTLRVSAQQALLGEVTTRLQAVTCGLRDRKITVRAYFRGPVTNEDLERIQMVGAEVIAHFPEGYRIEEECRSIEEYEAEMLDFWAFTRADE